MLKKDLARLIRKHIIESVSWKPPVGRKPFIRLDLNEGHGLLDKKILKKLQNIGEFVVTSYPEYDELNESLAKYCGVPTENVCLTSGSDHAIQMLLNLFFSEGNRVVVPAPTFFVYFSTLKLIGATPETIVYKKDNDKFVFPFKETLEALTSQTKGLLLCNPNNPLGVSIPKDELLALIKKTHDYKIPVIIDEAYAEFSGFSVIDLLATYNNIIILRTFSKAFGLAGARLGYVVAAPSVIEEMIKLRLPWAVNHFAVHAGVTALKNLSYFKKALRSVIERKNKIAEVIKKAGMTCIETDTNFLIIKTPRHQEFIEHLKKHWILVNDVSHYPHSGGILEECVRMSVPSKEDFKTVITAIKSF